MTSLLTNLLTIVTNFQPDTLADLDKLHRDNSRVGLGDLLGKGIP